MKANESEVLGRADLGNQPSVDVVMVQWGKAPLTLACLESLRKLVYPVRRIVVCDNGTPQSADSVEQWMRTQTESSSFWWQERDGRLSSKQGQPADSRSRFHLVRRAANGGFATGVNAALAVTSMSTGSDFVWIVNNDLTVDSESLGHLVHRAMQSNAEARPYGLLGCTQVDADRSGGGSPRLISSGGYAFSKWTGRDRLLVVDSAGDSDRCVERTMSGVQGAAMFLRRELIDEIGGLDSRFFLFFEEQDLANRVAATRFAIGTATAAIVHHAPGSSSRSGSDRPPLVDYHKARSIAVYYKRWHPNLIGVAILRVIVVALKRVMTRNVGCAAAAMSGLQCGLRFVMNGGPQTAIPEATEACHQPAEQETDPMTTTEQTCVACGSSTEFRTAACPGYVRGSVFALFECTSCGTVACSPRSNAPELYDAIYRHREDLEGYSRYERFARGAAGAVDPLGYLAKQEDVYWGMREALMRATDDPGRIAEVGCGLGYVTAALRRSGRDACGIDHSAEAVRRAIRRFGDHYVCADIVDPSTDLGRFDTVIALELIEHVVNPHSFLEAILQLVLPGGRAIISTPNRSIYPTESLWRTDSPPVHLSWFTESGMRALAASLGWNTEFVNFASMHDQVWSTVGVGNPAEFPQAKFDEQLVPLGVSKSYRLRETLASSQFASQLARRLSGAIKPDRVRLVEQSHTMVAILTRKA
jgi:GT2 family glycosyltransferase/SAM-dependent methyltransferase